jgi:peptidoglycan hydrolase CwlO-like protein
MDMDPEAPRDKIDRLQAKTDTIRERIKEQKEEREKLWQESQHLRKEIRKIATLLLLARAQNFLVIVGSGLVGAILAELMILTFAPKTPTLDVQQRIETLTRSLDDATTIIADIQREVDQRRSLVTELEDSDPAPFVGPGIRRILNCSITPA